MSKILSDECWLNGQASIGCSGRPQHDHASYVIKCCVNKLHEGLKHWPMKLASHIIIRDFVFDELFRIFELVDAGHEDFSGYDTTLFRCNVIDQADIWHKDKIIDESIAYDIFSYIHWYVQEHITEKEYQCVLGQHNDPREVGIEWGWIRAIGDCFYLKKLNPQNAHRMYEHAKQFHYAKWTVEVKNFHSKRKVFWAVPTDYLSDIKYYQRDVIV